MELFTVRNKMVKIITVKAITSETLSYRLSFCCWFSTQDLISNSPYCLPYSFCDVSLERLVLDQLIIF